MNFVNYYKYLLFYLLIILLINKILFKTINTCQLNNILIIFV